MKYNVKYFQQKFEAISACEWGIGQFDDKKGHRCALGHCGVEFSMIERAQFPLEAQELCTIFSVFDSITANDTVVAINDGIAWPNKVGLKPDNPRDRILMILQYIREHPVLVYNENDGHVLQ